MRALVLMVFMMTSISLFAQDKLPENIQIIEQMKSEYVSSRDVYVRLPVDYDENKTYSVLYMHDGQMLFSDLETWNGQSWEVNKTINQLVEKNEIDDFILVGISSISEVRHSNYYPEKPFLNLPKPLRDSVALAKRGDQPFFGTEINSDDYLKFLAYELKPFIDEKYATKKEAEHTFIAGSSMGGLISMYAFFEYPELFGAAACLSTHWVGLMHQNEEIPATFYNYIKNRKELLKGRKLYFDYGTETLDALYGTHQEKVDRLFEGEEAYENGYLSRRFEGAAHMETAWKKRFGDILKYFLTTEK